VGDDVLVDDGPFDGLAEPPPLHAVALLASTSTMATADQRERLVCTSPPDRTVLILP
jgi:hypothetical protein